MFGKCNVKLSWFPSTSGEYGLVQGKEEIGNGRELVVYATITNMEVDYRTCLEEVSGFDLTF